MPARRRSRCRGRCDSSRASRHWGGRCAPPSRRQQRRTRTAGTTRSSIAVEHDLRLVGRRRARGARRCCGSGRSVGRVPPAGCRSPPPARRDRLPMAVPLRAGAHRRRDRVGDRGARLGGRRRRRSRGRRAGLARSCQLRGSRPRRAQAAEPWLGCADADRATGRRARRRRADQPADRRATSHGSRHGEDPPRPRLRQDRPPLTDRARRGVRARSSELEVRAPDLSPAPGSSRSCPCERCGHRQRRSRDRNRARRPSHRRPWCL